MISVDEFIKPLWEAGKTASQIAMDASVQFGRVISRSAVCGIVNRRGWSRCADAPRHAKANKTLPDMRRRHGGGLPKPELPPAPAAPRATLVASKPVGLFADEAKGRCKWPLWAFGENGAPEFLVCGAKRDGEGPYCAGHARMARSHEKRENRSEERESSDLASRSSLLAPHLEAAE